MAASNESHASRKETTDVDKKKSDVPGVLPLDDFDAEWNPMEAAFNDPEFNHYSHGPAKYAPISKVQAPFSNDLGPGLEEYAEPYKLFIRKVPLHMNEGGMSRLIESVGVKALNVFKKHSDHVSKDGKKGWMFAQFAKHSEAKATIEGLHNKPPLFLDIQFARTDKENAKLAKERQEQRLFEAEQQTRLATQASAKTRNEIVDTSDVLPGTGRGEKLRASGRGLPLGPACRLISYPQEPRAEAISQHAAATLNLNQAQDPLNQESEIDIFSQYAGGFNDDATAVISKSVDRLQIDHNPANTRTRNFGGRGYTITSRQGDRRPGICRGSQPHYKAVQHRELAEEKKTAWEKSQDCKLIFSGPNGATGSCEKCHRNTGLRCICCHTWFCSEACLSLAVGHPYKCTPSVEERVDARWKANYASNAANSERRFTHRHSGGGKNHPPTPEYIEPDYGVGRGLPKQPELVLNNNTNSVDLNSGTQSTVNTDLPLTSSGKALPQRQSFTKPKFVSGLSLPETIETSPEIVNTKLETVTKVEPVLPDSVKSAQNIHNTDHVVHKSVTDKARNANISSNTESSDIDQADVRSGRKHKNRKSKGSEAYPSAQKNSEMNTTDEGKNNDTSSLQKRVNANNLILCSEGTLQQAAETQQATSKSFAEVCAPETRGANFNNLIMCSELPPETSPHKTYAALVKESPISSNGLSQSSSVGNHQITTNVQASVTAVSTSVSSSPASLRKEADLPSNVSCRNTNETERRQEEAKTQNVAQSEVSTRHEQSRTPPVVTPDKEIQRKALTAVNQLTGNQSIAEEQKQATKDQVSGIAQSQSPQLKSSTPTQHQRQAFSKAVTSPDRHAYECSNPQTKPGQLVQSRACVGEAKLPSQTQHALLFKINSTQYTQQPTSDTSQWQTVSAKRHVQHKNMNGQKSHSNWTSVPRRNSNVPPYTNPMPCSSSSVESKNTLPPPSYFVPLGPHNAPFMPVLPKENTTWASSVKSKPESKESNRTQTPAAVAIEQPKCVHVQEIHSVPLKEPQNNSVSKDAGTTQHTTSGISAEDITPSMLESREQQGVIAQEKAVNNQFETPQNTNQSDAQVSENASPNSQCHSSPSQSPVHKILSPNPSQSATLPIKTREKNVSDMQSRNNVPFAQGFSNSTVPQVVMSSTAPQYSVSVPRGPPPMPYENVPNLAKNTHQMSHVLPPFPNVQSHNPVSNVSSCNLMPNVPPPTMQSSAQTPPASRNVSQMAAQTPPASRNVSQMGPNGYSAYTPQHTSMQCEHRQATSGYNAQPRYYQGRQNQSYPQHYSNQKRNYQRDVNQNWHYPEQHRRLQGLRDTKPPFILPYPGSRANNRGGAKFNWNRQRVQNRCNLPDKVQKQESNIFKQENMSAVSEQPQNVATNLPEEPEQTPIENPVEAEISENRDKASDNVDAESTAIQSFLETIATLNPEVSKGESCNDIPDISSVEASIVSSCKEESENFPTTFEVEARTTDDGKYKTNVSQEVTLPAEEIGNNAVAVNHQTQHSTEMDKELMPVDPKLEVMPVDPKLEVMPVDPKLEVMPVDPKLEVTPEAPGSSIENVETQVTSSVESVSTKPRASLNAKKYDISPNHNTASTARQYNKSGSQRNNGHRSNSYPHQFPGLTRFYPVVSQPPPGVMYTVPYNPEMQYVASPPMSFAPEVSQEDLPLASTLEYYFDPHAIPHCYYPQESPEQQVQYIPGESYTTPVPPQNEAAAMVDYQYPVYYPTQSPEYSEAERDDSFTPMEPTYQIMQPELFQNQFPNYFVYTNQNETVYPNQPVYFQPTYYDQQMCQVVPYPQQPAPVYQQQMVPMLPQYYAAGYGPVVMNPSSPIVPAHHTQPPPPTVQPALPQRTLQPAVPPQQFTLMQRPQRFGAVMPPPPMPPFRPKKQVTFTGNS